MVYFDNSYSSYQHKSLLALILSTYVFLLAVSGTLVQKKKKPEEKPQTECNEKSDRRYAVCTGAWSSKTTALFNTWMAPDLNPGRRLDFASPDGRKVIRVRDVHVRIEIDGRSYWTPFGNMHDAEVGWAPDSKRLFVTWTETGQLGPWHTQVFELNDHGLKEIPTVTRHVREDMVARMKRAPIPKWVTRNYRQMWDSLDYCADDVVGSQWLNGSTELLVAGLAGRTADASIWVIS